MSGITTLSSCSKQTVVNNNGGNCNNAALSNTTNGLELTESCGRALKLQTDTPHLVSMGGGRLSTSVTLHPIPQGRITLGSGHNVDIPVQGTGVSPLHCHIENSEGIVTIYPLSENLCIDGNKVNGPTRLTQGAMLTIGRSNYMRFNHPAEAKLMKSVLPNSRISMAPITFNNPPILDVNQTANKFNKKPPTIPRKSPRESLTSDTITIDETPSSIMTKVTKFEYLAAQNMKQQTILSPKVFSSNLVTVNTPAKDVLGKTPNLESLSKHLPQSAVNYSDLTDNKEKNKTPDRQLFGRKSPQYVNVTINEPKSINNRVIMYENNDCLIKAQNNVQETTYTNIELNNISMKKTNNMNSSCTTTTTTTSNNTPNTCIKLPSPAYNRNPSYFGSATSSPIVMNGCNNGNVVDQQQQKINGDKSGSLDNLNCRNKEAELRRNQALADRVKEQEIEKAEQARLEEILNMCAEYEKQAQIEKNNKHIPKGIKTNGSLPRDKRQCISPSLMTSSPNLIASPSSGLPQNGDQQIFKFDVEHIYHGKMNHSYENVSCSPMSYSKSSSENIDLTPGKISPELRNQNCCSPYENIVVTQSPRTRIKTFLGNRDSTSKDTTTSELIETKFATVNHEHNLLLLDKHVKKEFTESIFKEIDNINTDNDLPNRKLTPTKFILPIDHEEELTSYIKPLENYENVTLSNFNGLPNTSVLLKPKPEIKVTAMEDYRRKSVEKSEIDRQRMEYLKKMKRESLQTIAKLKRQMAEMEIQAEELNREVEMEKALIFGEHSSRQLEVHKLDSKKEKLIKRGQKIEDRMKDCQIKQEQDQKECKEKLQRAQENLCEIEEKMIKTTRNTPEYEAVFEEYLDAQERLDNERKNFEDLEFHHLEEEADWLASREEIQREIMELTKKIDDSKNTLMELHQQDLITSRNNLDEYKKIQDARKNYQCRIEEIKDELKNIDIELHNYSVQESEQEVSSDSEDSEKGNKSSKFDFMSCSMIERTNENCTTFDSNVYNMSQSFNEKMLQEKSILEGGLIDRCPSQDDIDRISKVTSIAPIKIGNDGENSLNRKTIESLKEIEQNRRIHLAQQGSQVIEQERRRVLALKQRVQHEVRTKWAQRRQDCSSLTSTGSEDTQNSMTGSEEVDKKNLSNTSESEQIDKEQLMGETESVDSPRPLSETSDISVDLGTLSRRRGRPLGDKHRPLTRYLPIRDSDLDLRQHIETAGHQVVLCPHVLINSSSCKGFLHKRGSKLNSWSRRWFVFDRNKRTFSYYSDKTEKKLRGGAYFQAIEEVYLDHANSVKSPNPHLTFIVKTHERFYYLMAPSPEAMRIWIDVIFTGAEGYQEFQSGT